MSLSIVPVKIHVTVAHWLTADDIFHYHCNRSDLLFFCCKDCQLQNVEIVADLSTFNMEASYDRIFSIEMFEHMKNYRDLLKKLSSWMKYDSLLFVHYFCQKTFAYHFEDAGEDDWITTYFFTWDDAFCEFASIFPDVPESFCAISKLWCLDKNVAPLFYSFNHICVEIRGVHRGRNETTLTPLLWEEMKK